MKPLLKTLAILAFVALVVQTVRHAYMLWFEPRGSVLDKYDQPVKSEIGSAASLDELLRQYDPVRKQVDELSKTSSTPAYEQTQKEPFKTEQALRLAISEWDERSKEIRAIRFYCLVAAVLFVLGLFAYKKINRWLGLTLLIAAFSEFIYWTSPTFIGATREFDRLLVNKLVLSIVALALLVGAIWFLDIFAEKEQGSA
jgi:hypothetical protein